MDVEPLISLPFNNTKKPNNEEQFQNYEVLIQNDLNSCYSLFQKIEEKGNVNINGGNLFVLPKEVIFYDFMKYMDSHHLL